MNEDERRKHTRVPVKIPARVSLKGKPEKAVEAEILVISEGGAFVHCSTPINLGQEVIVEIRFGETKLIAGKIVRSDDFITQLTPRDLTSTSVIRWARGSSNPGFGVEFVDMEPMKREFLSKVMQYFRQLYKAGVHFEET